MIKEIIFLVIIDEDYDGDTDEDDADGDEEFELANGAAPSGGCILRSADLQILQEVSLEDVATRSID